MIKTCCLVTTLMLAAGAALAQEQKPQGCAAPEHRQFDFWIGNWEVKNPKGEVVGTNRISSILGGCALMEEWSGKGGFEGKSLNTYDPAARTWHQTWVDNGPGRLELTGAFAHGAMILAGKAPDAKRKGRMAMQRIMWTPNADGTVRQLWESSSDGGRRWKPVFDGTYTRQP